MIEGLAACGLEGWLCAMDEQAGSTGEYLSRGVTLFTLANLCVAR